MLHTDLKIKTALAIAAFRALLESSQSQARGFRRNRLERRPLSGVTLQNRYLTNFVSKTTQIHYVKHSVQPRTLVKVLRTSRTFRVIPAFRELIEHNEPIPVNSGRLDSPTNFYTNLAPYFQNNIFFIRNLHSINRLNLLRFFF